MNVIVINDNPHVNGGAAKVAIQQAVGLADRGHDVYFVCAVLPVAEALHHSNIRIICSEQTDLLAAPNRLTGMVQGYWNVKAAQMLRDLFRQLDGSDTIIHLHVWSRALSPSVVGSSLNSRFPTICTLHDFVLACPNGTFFDHRRQKVCELIPMSGACIASNCDTRNYGHKLWRVGRNFVQNEIAHASTRLKHVIVHSTLARDVMQPYLAPNCTVHKLPIYIESKAVAPVLPEEDSSYAYMGRLVREKGVLLAARAAAAERVPITFIGEGPLANEIRAANPQAQITGWLDEKTAVEHLRAARALIFPSLWYETLGLVVLEAAAHGIPSIVPDTSAARESVLDGVTGLHFRSGDETDLRGCIRKLENIQFVRELGRAAYKRFWSTQYNSLEAHISRLLSIYEAVLCSEKNLTMGAGALEVNNAH